MATSAGPPGQTAAISTDILINGNRPSHIAAVLIDPATGLPTAPGGGAGGAVTDANSRAFYGETAMAVDTVYPAGRTLKILCTVAGNVSVTYSDGSTGIWIISVGLNTLPVECTKVNSAGTTATATYSNLK